MTAQAVDLDSLSLVQVRDILIHTYVPEAEQLTWDDAFALAVERDQLAAQQLADDYTALQLEKAAEKARVMDDEAPFDNHYIDMMM